MNRVSNKFHDEELSRVETLTTHCVATLLLLVGRRDWLFDRMCKGSAKSLQLGVALNPSKEQW
jgi:hypothetical protein